MSAIDVRTGARLRSVVCGTEVIVVRAPSSPVVIECGGVPMVPVSDATAPSQPGEQAEGEGTKVGKRYTHAGTGLELLCTRPGSSSLSASGEALTIKVAKLLPSSD